MARELGDELVGRDLRQKHDRMARDALHWLRATYWRWAEAAPGLLPKRLLKVSEALAVGDIHLENYGTWRDLDGRLIWGINDYDEAAAMPWTLDLVRLVTSALASGAVTVPTGRVARVVLEGYAMGVARPRPHVLDQEPGRLRQAVDHARPKHGERWWHKLEADIREAEPGPRWQAALRAALPAEARLRRFGRLTKGGGSLGRPRWVALAEWRGGLIAREAKAMLTSGWLLAGHGGGATAPRCLEATTGPYRVPDPWFNVTGMIAVRRLSPSNEKIERGDDVTPLLHPALLRAMGRELASLHRGTLDRARLAAELEALPKHWLAAAAETMAAWTDREWRRWRRHHAAG